MNIEDIFIGIHWLAHHHPLDQSEECILMTWGRATEQRDIVRRRVFVALARITATVDLKSISFRIV